MSISDLMKAIGCCCLLAALILCCHTLATVDAGQGARCSVGSTAAYPSEAVAMAQPIPGGMKPAPALAPVQPSFPETLPESSYASPFSMSQPVQQPAVRPDRLAMNLWTTPDTPSIQKESIENESVQNEPNETEASVIASTESLEIETPEAPEIAAFSYDYEYDLPMEMTSETALVLDTTVEPIDSITPEDVAAKDTTQQEEPAYEDYAFEYYVEEFLSQPSVDIAQAEPIAEESSADHSTEMTLPDTSDTPDSPEASSHSVLADTQPSESSIMFVETIVEIPMSPDDADEAAEATEPSGNSSADESSPEPMTYDYFSYEFDEFDIDSYLPDETEPEMSVDTNRSSDNAQENSDSVDTVDANDSTEALVPIHGSGECDYEAAVAAKSLDTAGDSTAYFEQPYPYFDEYAAFEEKAGQSSMSAVSASSVSASDHVSNDDLDRLYDSFPEEEYAYDNYYGDDGYSDVTYSDEYEHPKYETCPEMADGPDYDARDEATEDFADADDSESFTGFDYEFIEPSQPFASSRTAPQQSLAELTAAPLDLYSVSASELLSETDQALIDTLRVLADAPAGTRRLEFDEYLQMLGPDAIAFAANCQKETGVDICGLSNDPACIAVFLGVFRMVEQGRLDRTLAAGQLQQSLILIDQNWLRQIN